MFKNILKAIFYSNKKKLIIIKTSKRFKIFNKLNCKVFKNQEFKRKTYNKIRREYFKVLRNFLNAFFQ